MTGGVLFSSGFFTATPEILNLLLPAGKEESRNVSTFLF